MKDEVKLSNLAAKMKGKRKVHYYEGSRNEPDKSWGGQKVFCPLQWLGSILSFLERSPCTLPTQIHPTLADSSSFTFTNINQNSIGVDS